jgi:capsular polysaccharide biosynthesis protein
VATAVILAAAVLIASGSASTNRPWADVSLIWMIAPLLIIALAFVTALGLLIYAFARLLKVTPKYTAKAQFYLDRVAAGINKVADGTTKPVVWVEQASAIFKSIFKL